MPFETIIENEGSPATSRSDTLIVGFAVANGRFVVEPKRLKSLVT
jgi:hypothetical protein